jgi:hypothetical protein
MSTYIWSDSSKKKLKCIGGPRTVKKAAPMSLNFKKTGVIEVYLLLPSKELRDWLRIVDCDAVTNYMTTLVA